MANTPHISVRVPPEKLEVWKNRCDSEGLDVSFQIRRLMDAWCLALELRQEAEELAKVETREDTLSSA